MWWFAGLLAGFSMFAYGLLWQMWVRSSWDQSTRLVRGALFVLPWLPLVFVILFKVAAHPNQGMTRLIMGVCGLFGFSVSCINLYRSLWTVLLRFQTNYWQGAGELLIKITLVIVLAITGLVALFALGYDLTAYLYRDSLGNCVYQLGGDPLVEGNWAEYFYFSAVTYFSLGYGDYIPRGTIMLSLVYAEALLGYINSGIIIAYAFNLFNRLSITWGFWPRQKPSGRFRRNIKR